MARTQQKSSHYSLKPAEIKKLIFSCKNFRNRCLIKLMAYTGMRRAEVKDLDIQDLDFERRRIHIRSGKGGKSRVVVVSQSVLADLTHLIGNQQKGPVFISNKNSRFNNAQINRIIAQAGEAAKIVNPNPQLKHINPHLLRHSYGRNARAAGQRIEFIQHQLGHASIKTTMDIYGKPSVDDMQEDYEQKMEGIYG